jgi:hypothetical protein
VKIIKLTDLIVNFSDKGRKEAEAIMKAFEKIQKEGPKRPRESHPEKRSLKRSAKSESTESRATALSESTESNAVMPESTTSRAVTSDLKAVVPESMTVMLELTESKTLTSDLEAVESMVVMSESTLSWTDLSALLEVSFKSAEGQGKGTIDVISMIVGTESVPKEEKEPENSVSNTADTKNCISVTNSTNIEMGVWDKNAREEFEARCKRLLDTDRKDMHPVVSFAHKFNFTFKSLTFCQEVLVLTSARLGRRSLRSASGGDFIVPPTNTVMIQQQAYSVVGPSVWNSLSSGLRSLPQNFSGSFYVLLKTSFWLGLGQECL